MAVPAGPPTSDKPTISGPKSAVEVEDSRTQRLQRQQARFRDRGGIFVPTNRNTLVNILLGRAPASQSPKRVHGRSTSISPQKSKGKRLETVKKDVAEGAEVGEDTPLRRTSPRKQARKEKLGSADLQPVAGPSRLADSGSKLSVEPKPSRAKLKAKLKCEARLVLLQISVDVNLFL
ncbi:hypothetical protein BDQ12DRAFT_152452 [Crucibulum laeve]|uniref:Uncharacterized protein n=1 Tax=Crucibulum laeve TaxID=68775 RepID=A0A5C3M0L8_9AGAR|nr:hypothetical protein BDQ12DRAFT_152452 [Crucibulum laeve]